MTKNISDAILGKNGDQENPYTDRQMQTIRKEQMSVLFPNSPLLGALFKNAQNQIAYNENQLGGDLDIDPKTIQQCFDQFVKKSTPEKLSEVKDISDTIRYLEKKNNNRYNQQLDQEQRQALDKLKQLTLSMSCMICRS